MIGEMGTFTIRYYILLLVSWRLRIFGKKKSRWCPLCKSSLEKVADSLFCHCRQPLGTSGSSGIPMAVPMHTDNFKGSTVWGFQCKECTCKKHVCSILGLSVWKMFFFCPEIVKSELLMLPESNVLLQPQARNVPMILWNQDDSLEVLWLSSVKLIGGMFIV